MIYPCYLSTDFEVSDFSGGESKKFDDLHAALNYLIQLTAAADIVCYTLLNEIGETILHDMLSAGCEVYAKKDGIPKFFDDLDKIPRGMVYNATSKNISDIGIKWIKRGGKLHLINAVNICEYAPDSPEDVGNCLKWYRANCSPDYAVSGASYAFGVFRRMVNQSRFPALPDSIFETLQAGIVGGWNYVNKAGEVVKNVTTLDKNSMYADFLRNSYLPYGLPVQVGSIETPEELMEYADNLPADKFSFIDFDACLLDLKEGAFPFLTDTRTHLFNPTKYLTSTAVVNKFMTTGYVKLPFAQTGLTPEEYEQRHNIKPVRFVLTVPEFNLMRECYTVHITAINAVLEFSADNTIFRDFVDNFYSLKAAANDDKCARYCAKKCLTSVLGKFCKNKQFEITLYRLPEGDQDGLQSEITYQATKGSYLPIYVATVSLARVAIINDAMRCGSESFCYSDTDSLHITGATPDGLPVGAGLGEYKIEHKSSRAIYIKHKAYILQDAETGAYTVHVAGMQRATAAWLADGLKTGAIDLAEVKAGYNFDAPDNHGEILHFGFHADL